MPDGRTERLSGGPLNELLNAARPLPQARACPMNVVAPATTLVLRYHKRDLDRRIVIDMSGCPSIMLPHQRQLALTMPGIVRIYKLGKQS